MEGRVEIFYKGEWGTVCHTNWDLRDAVVVCRQLGYTTAVRRSIDAEFGEGTGRIWLSNVHCSGTESTLSSCNANAWGYTNCYHNQDAGVVCASKFDHISSVLQNFIFSDVSAVSRLFNMLYSSCMQTATLQSL